MFKRLRPSVIAGVLAALLIAMAALRVPERLYYTLSHDKVLSASSLNEVAVARWGLFGTGAVLGLGLLLFKIFGQAAWAIRLSADYDAFVEREVDDPHRTLARVPLQTELIIFFANALLFAALMQTIRWSFEFHDRGVAWFDLLALESGIWESLTAAGLFVAGLVLIVAGWSFRSVFVAPVAWLVPLSMGLLFIAGAGEEVSWGQHWLGFETPSAIKSVNTQGEANLHNLFGHWANNLQMVAFLMYVGILPVVARLSVLVRYLCDRAAVPIGPLVLVPFGVVGTLLDSRPRFAALWGDPPWRLSEARETLFGVAVFCIAGLAAMDWKRRFELKSSAAGAQERRVPVRESASDCDSRP